MGPIRIEVEHFPAGDRQVVTVDDDLVTDETRSIVDQAVLELADLLGVHPDKVALGMVAELVERHHDRLAYQRECARRGVLAL